MRRRAFSILLCGAICWPLATFAQAKVPTVGFLGPTAASVATARTAAFRQRLQELGWIEGKTVAIEYRWADGNTKRFSELAAELARRNVDVIVTWGTATAIAAKQATSLIPIVFTIVDDPVGSGLVASLPRPGGNVTGLSTEHPEAAGKRLELMREMIPDLHRLGVLANSGNTGAMEEMHDIGASARALGIAVTIVGVNRAEDIAPAIAALKGNVDGLYIASDALVSTNRAALTAAALNAGIPTATGFRDMVVAGGLMSYGPKYLDLMRGAADYVDKILRGAKPADLPVQQPTTFEFVVNLKTAKALGIKVPPDLLARADEVIE
jgi:putative tryptophan/tyrosine transport system substrate-binding protein